jgi:hypothetical protein
MTDHPITPPPELIQRWSEQFEAGRSLYAMFEDIYRAGADQELEACCEWVDWKWSGIKSRELRAARRPNPPSLKEQALKELEFLTDTASGLGCDGSAIRRALEQLPDSIVVFPSHC